MKGLILAAAAVAAVSVTAQAQTGTGNQTPASAIEFLGIVLPGKELTRTWIVPPDAPVSAPLPLSGKIVRVTSEQENCRIKFDYGPPLITTRRDGSKVPLGTGTPMGPSNQGSSEAVNMKLATAVTRPSTGVVRVEAPYGTWALNIGSSELAQRVENAFKFLKARCDPAASTGF